MNTRLAIAAVVLAMMAAAVLIGVQKLAGVAKETIGPGDAHIHPIPSSLLAGGGKPAWKLIQTARCTVISNDKDKSVTVSLFKAPDLMRIEDKYGLEINRGKKVWAEGPKWAKDPKGYFESDNGNVPNPEMFCVDRDSEQAKKRGEQVELKETTAEIEGRTYRVLETSVWWGRQVPGSSAPGDICDFRYVTAYDPQTRLKLRETDQIGNQQAHKLVDRCTKYFEYDLPLPNDADLFVFKPPAGAKFVKSKAAEPGPAADAGKATPVSGQEPTLESKMQKNQRVFDVVHRYLKAIGDGRYEDARSLLTADLQSKITPEQLGNYESQYGYSIGGWCDPDTNIIQSGGDDRRYAVVLRNNRTQAAYIYLELENDQWRVLSLSPRYELLPPKDAALAAAARGVIEAWCQHDWEKMYDFGAIGSKGRSKLDYVTWAKRQKLLFDPVNCLQVCRSTLSYSGVTCVEVLAVTKRGERDAWAPSSTAQYNEYRDNEINTIDLLMKCDHGKWRLTNKRGE